MVISLMQLVATVGRASDPAGMHARTGTWLIHPIFYLSSIAGSSLTLGHGGKKDRIKEPFLALGRQADPQRKRKEGHNPIFFPPLVRWVGLMTEAEPTMDGWVGTSQRYASSFIYSELFPPARGEREKLFRLQGTLLEIIIFVFNRQWESVKNRCSA